MRFQLTMIARHFEDGLRALGRDPADHEAAERAYGIGFESFERDGRGLPSFWSFGSR